MFKKIQFFTLSVFVCGVFCAAVSAQDVKREAPQTAKPAVKYSGSMRGETYAYKYTEQDFADAPAWKAEEGEPPLNVTRALQIARANLPRFVEISEKWKVRHVWLQSVRDDKWFYNISFTCSDAACRELPTRQFSLIVKMDGSLLEPKKIVLVD